MAKKFLIFIKLGNVNSQHKYIVNSQILQTLQLTENLELLCRFWCPNHNDECFSKSEVILC